MYWRLIDNADMYSEAAKCFVSKNNTGSKSNTKTSKHFEKKKSVAQNPKIEVRFVGPRRHPRIPWFCWKARNATAVRCGWALEERNWAPEKCLGDGWWAPSLSSRPSWPRLKREMSGIQKKKNKLFCWRWKMLLKSKVGNWWKFRNSRLVWCLQNVTI